MKVVLASHNQKKMVEMKAILSQMGVEVLSQAEVGVDLEDWPPVLEYTSVSSTSRFTSRFWAMT